MSEIEGESTGPETPLREPAFNAPAVSLAFVALLLIAYAVQVFLLSPDDVMALALSSPALAQGRWWTLISHIFLHGGLLHLFMNVGAAIAFGPAVARHFGPGPRAAGTFLLYVLVCGIAGGLGYIAMHPGSQDQVIGASGAISGLWGGAARLLGRWRGLSGLWDPPVRGQILAVVVINLLIGLTGFADGGLHIAWEAHIAGFVAGLVLIAPFTGLARSSYRAED